MARNQFGEMECKNSSTMKMNTITKSLLYFAYRLQAKHGFLLFTFFAPLLFLVVNTWLGFFSMAELDAILLFYPLAIPVPFMVGLTFLNEQALLRRIRKIKKKGRLPYGQRPSTLKAKSNKAHPTGCHLQQRISLLPTKHPAGVPPPNSPSL